MGKTAWAINIAENAAVRDGKVVAVFSLEMSKESLLRRTLASQALVSMQKNPNRLYSQGRPEQIDGGAGAAGGGQDIYRRYARDRVSEMRAKARRLQRQQGVLDLIVIDYLQLMTASTFGGGRQAL